MLHLVGLYVSSFSAPFSGYVPIIPVVPSPYVVNGDSGNYVQIEVTLRADSNADDHTLRLVAHSSSDHASRSSGVAQASQSTALSKTASKQTVSVELARPFVWTWAYFCVECYDPAGRLHMSALNGNGLKVVDPWGVGGGGSLLPEPKGGSGKRMILGDILSGYVPIVQLMNDLVYPSDPPNSQISIQVSWQLPANATDVQLQFSNSPTFGNIANNQPATGVNEGDGTQDGQYAITSPGSTGTTNYSFNTFSTAPSGTLVYVRLKYIQNEAIQYYTYPYYVRFVAGIRPPF